MNKILVVAAHPDDEILGAGGTLIKHVARGDDVYCLILGEGMMARQGKTKNDVSGLQKASLKAGRIIGFKKTHFSNFPDNSFDSVSLLKIAQEVEKHIEKIRPSLIYTHHQNDLNVDHRLSFQAVLTACRPCGENTPKEILTFETLSSTEWQTKNNKMFMPNLYENISGTISKKIKALKEYKTEMRRYPHSRSVEGIRILAQYRGLESGLKFAEAFCLIRKISNN